MQKEFLTTLQCPYTGSELTLTKVFDVDADGIRFGIVSSEAGDFPILDGILRLQYDDLRPVIVDALRNGRADRAMEIGLDWPCRTWTTAAVDLLNRATLRGGVPGLAPAIARLKRQLHQKLSQPRSSFCDLLDGLPVPAYWREWQKYRFSMATFLSVYPLLGLIKERGRVLDFACGLGHASYLVARAVGDANTTCADYSFSSLHIAKRYFVPHANFVCLDGNGLLPFRSDTYSAVLCSDAYHFITQKLALAREMGRIVGPRGKILLGHVHNKFSPLTSGAALRPAAYANLFADLEVRVLPERILIDDYFKHDTLDLETVRSPEQLDRSIEGLSVVASGDRELFRKHSDVFASSLALVRHPILNPIYRATNDGSEIVLQKQVSPAYQKRIEMRTGTWVLPDYRLNASYLRDATGALRNENPPALGGLLRDLIAIDAPERYVTTSFLS